MVFIPSHPMYIMDILHIPDRARKWTQLCPKIPCWAVCKPAQMDHENGWWIILHCNLWRTFMLNSNIKQLNPILTCCSFHVSSRIMGVTSGHRRRFPAQQPGEAQKLPSWLLQKKLIHHSNVSQPGCPQVCQVCVGAYIQNINKWIYIYIYINIHACISIIKYMCVINCKYSCKPKNKPCIIWPDMDGKPKPFSVSGLFCQAANTLKAMSSETNTSMDHGYLQMMTI